MLKHPALPLALALGLIANAQAVNLRGKVTNQSGKAIAKAIVTLVPDGLKDTTGTDGSYSIATTGILTSPTHALNASGISVANGVLQITAENGLPVDVQVFNASGTRLMSGTPQNSSAGIYRCELGKLSKGTSVLLIKVSIGKNTTSFHYVQMNGGTDLNSTSGIITQAAGSLARTAAVAETLKVSATGYISKSIVFGSTDTTINITLDTNGGDRWGGLNNAPIKSAGCGKALGTISKSGTYSISSAGGRGTYIIDIPTSYNKDNPYRLVFGNHCMGGSAKAVAATDTKGVNTGEDLSGFYSIKTMMALDNIPGIYVALQGNSNGTWNPPDDSKFWNDVLTLVENNLCVDTTRVFVTGFSFGAMFSYVLSNTYPEKIRAVATYAPANYNMTQPNNRHIPIAYFQTTGTTDGTCPWVHSDANKQGGKYCLLQHMEDNGCTSTASDIKLATGSTHVDNDFKGCKEGYPVKFGSFVGGHQAESSDAGSSVNWIQKEAWAFFKQF
jgi:poly(3-hydroxybutyrate) depolymerase